MNLESEENLLMDSEPGSSRRQALRQLGLGLGVLSVGTATFTLQSLLPAAAEETTTTTDGGADQGLTEGELLGFLESLELAAVGAYDNALNNSLASAQGAVLTQMRDHHTVHAAAVAGLAGGDAGNQANPKLSQVLFDQMRGAKTQQALLKVLFDLEGALAATHLVSLGNLPTPTNEAAVASILPVESQHAVVMGQILGVSSDALVPAFEIVDGAVPPESFPLKESK